MKTKSLTHESISRRAQEIWEAEGKPAGRDLEIWLSAEQQLSAPAAEEHPASASRSKNETDFRHAGSSTVTADRIESETAAESVVEYNISPAVSQAAAVQAALQTTPSRGANPPRKAKSPATPAAPVRGSGQSQSSVTPAADPQPANPPLDHAPAPAAAPSPVETTAKAQQQKKAARAPQLPAKTAPKAAPPESGKPLWDKPHSS